MSTLAYITHVYLRYDGMPPWVPFDLNGMQEDDRSQERLAIDS